MAGFLVLVLTFLVGCNAGAEKRNTRGKGATTALPAPAIPEDPTPVIVSFNGVNEARDGLLTADEIDSSFPIASLVIKESKQFDFTAILGDAQNLICDEKQTYDLKVVPAIKTTPTIDGAYAVCVKAVNGSKTVYAKSQIVVRDSVVPLPLVNEAADGIVTAQEISSTLGIVSKIELNGLPVFYRLFTADVDCAAVDFSYSNIPRINELVGKHGTYKVCARISRMGYSSIVTESDTVTVVEDY